MRCIQASQPPLLHRNMFHSICGRSGLGFGPRARNELEQRIRMLGVEALRGVSRQASHHCSPGTSSIASVGVRGWVSGLVCEMNSSSACSELGSAPGRTQCTQASQPPQRLRNILCSMGFGLELAFRLNARRQCDGGNQGELPWWQQVTTGVARGHGSCVCQRHSSSAKPHIRTTYRNLSSNGRV